MCTYMYMEHWLFWENNILEWGKSFISSLSQTFPPHKDLLPFPSPRFPLLSWYPFLSTPNWNPSSSLPIHNITLSSFCLGCICAPRADTAPSHCQVPLRGCSYRSIYTEPQCHLSGSFKVHWFLPMQDCYLFWQWLELACVYKFRCMLAAEVHSDGKSG